MALVRGTTTPATSQNEWLQSRREIADSEPVSVLGFVSANTTGLGAIKGGTVMGKITSGGKHRPCGNAEVNGAQAADTTILVNAGEAANFYAGDSVAVISTLGVAGSASMADLTAADDDITLTGVKLDGLAHVVQLVDPAADKEEITGAISWAGTPGSSVATCTLTLGYSAAAIDSTIQELANAINTEFGNILYAVVVGTGTNVVDDAAVTGTLAGGTATGGTLDAANTIVSVDKSTHIITLTDAVTVADGDQIRLANGAQTPVGILENSVNTFSHVNASGVAIHSDKAGTILHGNVRADSSKLIGYSATFMLSSLKDEGIRV